MKKALLFICAIGNTLALTAGQSHSRNDSVVVHEDDNGEWIMVAGLRKKTTSPFISLSGSQSGSSSQTPPDYDEWKKNSSKKYINSSTQTSPSLNAGQQNSSFKFEQDESEDEENVDQTALFESKQPSSTDALKQDETSVLASSDGCTNCAFDSVGCLLAVPTALKHVSTEWWKRMQDELSEFLYNGTSKED